MKQPKEKEKVAMLMDKYLLLGFLSVDQAKQCALVCCDEIIKEYNEEICECGYSNDWDMWDSKKEFWQAVKEELK